MKIETKSEGFEVIHAYTRAQALDDGILVDLSDLAREAGFLWPVAVTQGVWAVLETSEALRAEGQSYIGRAWDILTILRSSLRSSKGGREVCFSALFVMEPGKSPRSISMRAVSGPGDEGEPTITILKPDED